MAEKLKQKNLNRKVCKKSLNRKIGFMKKAEQFWKLSAFFVIIQIGFSKSVFLNRFSYIMPCFLGFFRDNVT